MAGLINPKVYITPPDKDSVGETDANADVEISYELPNGELESYDNRDSYGVGEVCEVVYTAGQPEREIIYHPDGEGGHFINLIKGDDNDISVDVIVYYDRKKTTWQYTWGIIDSWEVCEPDTIITNPDGSTTTIPGRCWMEYERGAVLTGGNYEEPEITNLNQKIESNTVTVYTRPGKCEVFTSKDSNGNSLLYSGGTIYITGSMVNQWREHCGKYLSWRDQKNLYGTAKGVVSDDTKDPITAQWYNNLISSLGDEAPSQVDGGPYGTIIRAGHFTSLDGLVTKTGNVG